MKLLEKRRSELLDKSKSADRTKSYGTTRYDRRNAVEVFNTDRNFNNIDMNALFKSDTLSLLLPIHGERGNYEVEVLFNNVCPAIKHEIRANNYKLEFKCIYKALIRAVNNNDIYIGCSCSDFKYRFSYWGTKERYSSMKPQLVPAKITNPNNSKGAACKHVLNVLGNLDWVLKLASTINNYIAYMSENMSDKYEDIMFPAVFGMTYDQALKKGIIELPEEPEEEEPIEEPEEEPIEEEPIEEPEEEPIEDEIPEE